MRSGKPTIIFSGMIAADPHQGGATWAVLQYLLGLQRLGHSVWFIEPISPAALKPAGATLEQSDNAEYFREVMAEFGFTWKSGLLLNGSRQTVGISYDEMRVIGTTAPVLINVSGMLTDAEVIGRIPIRVYLDLDPAFVQLWHAVQHIDMRFDGHTHFVTVGQNIGRRECKIPTCGRKWIPTAPPVVLERWPREDRIFVNGLTTVGNWRGYGSIEHESVHYGQKCHSLRRFIDLPRRTSERFMPALAIHPDEKRDLDALHENGWHLLDTMVFGRSPDAYRHSIAGSKAEFSVAKSGYVVSRCGWFSDRSACYLASGRPVIAQETGFSRWLPTGKGLFSFDSHDEVLQAIEAINADYERHAKSARKLAEQYFDSDLVLARLLSEVGATA